MSVIDRAMDQQPGDEVSPFPRLPGNREFTVTGSCNGTGPHPAISEFRAVRGDRSFTVNFGPEPAREPG